MIIKEALVRIKTAIKGYYDSREASAITEMILEDLTGLSRVDRILHDKEVLSASQKATLNTAIHYLQLKMPVQYILGYSYFADLKLKVNNQVLIPRPETEELVYWVTETLKENSENKNASLIDLCTGSGCIALALKKNIPNLNVQGIDLSDGSLGVARHNSRLTRQAVRFFKMDLLDEQATSNLPMVDCLVSNPPYIHHDEKPEIEAHVIDYEPQMALFPDKQMDVTIFYKKIALLASKILNPGGYLFFELNPLYAAEIKNAVEAAGLHSVSIREDMQGLKRMLRAVK